MLFVWENFNDDSHQESKEWAVSPYDAKSGPFSVHWVTPVLSLPTANLKAASEGSPPAVLALTTSTDISYLTPIPYDFFFYGSVSFHFLFPPPSSHATSSTLFYL